MKHNSRSGRRAESEGEGESACLLAVFAQAVCMATDAYCVRCSDLRSMLFTLPASALPTI